MATLVIALPVTALADSFTFQAPVTAANEENGGKKEVDLDHQNYAWRITDSKFSGNLGTRNLKRRRKKVAVEQG